MRRGRRRRKVGKHISISATDADWETVRRNAKRRGLSIARYLVELVERDASEEDAGPALTLAAEEQRELLEAVRERKIQGLAPSAVAARVLAREAGIPTRTLQYFLTRFGDLSDPERLARARAEYGGAVLAVDEASMTGSVRMEALLRVAR